MRKTFVTLLLASVATLNVGTPASAVASCKTTHCMSVPTAADQIAPSAYVVDRQREPSVLSGTCVGLSGSDRTGCAALDGLVADTRRAAIFAELSKGWIPASRAAFTRLLAAEDAFAQAVGDNETDRLSDESGADAIVAQQAEKNAFLSTLKSVAAGNARLTFVEFAESDAGLNATYEQVMAVSDTSNLAWGSIQKAGIERTQRAWLVYRESFVAFAATLSPDAAAAVKAELTTRRTVSLEGFLED